MANTGHPTLCGGTFLTLILQSRKPTATRRQRTQGMSDVFKESDVLLGLVRIVNPDYIKPAGETFKTYTSKYKKCAEYTPNDLKFNNTSAFLSRLETNYADELIRMANFANQFIDIGSATGNGVLLVKRLIELIRDDKSIAGSCEFSVRRNGASITKDRLSEITEVCPPAFLLSVWKFIVTERNDNSAGAATILAWFPERRDRYMGPDGLSITQAIRHDSPDEVIGREYKKEVETPTVSELKQDNCAEISDVKQREIDHDYYNLFVVSDEIRNNRFSIFRERSLKGNSMAVKQFADLDDVAIARIKTLPSLIMNENTSYGGRTSPEQEAHFGFITDLKIQENGIIKVHFRCITTVNQQRINEIAGLLDIFTGAGIAELNQTHWTIKNVDLIEELVEAELLPPECTNSLQA